MPEFVEVTRDGHVLEVKLNKPKVNAIDIKMSQENEKILSSIDEMLNMAKDWTSLDLIWDMICFQFKEIESAKMEKVVIDLTEAGVIESRSV